MRFCCLLFCVLIAAVLGGESCQSTTVDSAFAEPADGAGSRNSLALIEADMREPHEGYPRGVPASMDWALGPRISYGNNPPAGWTAMIPWGQVYADSSGNPARNVRFQIRNVQSWYLSKATGTWQKWVRTDRIEGANYAEDFQDDINVPADIRDEADGGGSSATLAAGYNFHFWSADGRVSIDPTDIAGVWTAIESRLILDDPAGPDERDRARLLFSAGADYWRSLDAEWDQWKTNGDIAIGRFRYLTSEWQTFNMHTLQPEQLRNNPPPYR